MQKMLSYVFYFYLYFIFFFLFSLVEDSSVRDTSSPVVGWAKHKEFYSSNTFSVLSRSL